MQGVRLTHAVKTLELNMSTKAQARKGFLDGRINSRKSLGRRTLLLHNRTFKPEGYVLVHLPGGLQTGPKLWTFFGQVGVLRHAIARRMPLFFNVIGHRFELRERISQCSPRGPLRSKFQWSVTPCVFAASSLIFEHQPFDHAAAFVKRARSGRSLQVMRTAGMGRRCLPLTVSNDLHCNTILHSLA